MCFVYLPRLFHIESGGYRFRAFKGWGESFPASKVDSSGNSNY